MKRLVIEYLKQMPAVLRRPDRRWLTVGVFVCATLVQTAFASLLPTSIRRNESTDYVEYYSPVAQNILRGRGMVDASGKFADQYPPGFSLWLAGIYYLADLVGIREMIAVTYFNLLSMSCACVFIFWIAEKVFASRIALICAGLWITYPLNLWLTKQPNSEVPFCLLMYAAILCAVRLIQKGSAGYAIATGFLLGTAALIRPVALLLPLVVAATVLLNTTIGRKRRLTYVSVLVGAYCLTLMPWEATIYAATRTIVPLGTNGPSSMLDGFVMKRESSVEVPERVAVLLEQNWERRRELKTTMEIAQYLLSELKLDPRAFLELVALKAARSWYGTDSGRSEHQIQLIQLFYLVLGSAGMVLTIYRFPEQRKFMGLFVGLILYFWCMTVVALSIVRYLVPVMAFWFIPCAVAIDTVWLIKEGRALRTAPAWISG